MSKLADKLIAENKRTKDTSLDLGNCGLDKIPSAVADLVWLKSLVFADYWFEWDGRNWRHQSSTNGGKENKLFDLRALAGLSSLVTLVLYSTQVTDLTPLAHLSSLQNLDVSDTGISDLTPLRGLSSLQILDFSNTQVADLTPLTDLSSLQIITLFSTKVLDLTPLKGHSSLRTINFSRTEVADITPLAGLSSLENLILNETQVADITPLAGLSSLENLALSKTQVLDLTPLAGLSSLQNLEFSKTEVADLTPLAGLSSLQHLDFSKTEVRDLTPLAGLSSLQNLDFSKTEVIDLAPLAVLSSLQNLVISDTRVADLTFLAGLSSLQILDITSTEVKSLEPLIELIRRGCPVSTEMFSTDKAVRVAYCPLTNPPMEIAAQGNEAILNYFAERAKGVVDHIYEAKMLILGEGSAGKTSLIRRLYQPGVSLPEEKDTTRGIEIHKHEFILKNGRTFRLNVWDFGGQQIYHATHQFFLTQRSLYVLLDDTRKDHKAVSDDGFRYWLELIDVFGGHSPVLIFQNEKGGRSKAIDFKGIAQRYDNVKALYAGDLTHVAAADKLRDAVEFYASHLSHIGEELPASWVRVRTDVEEVAAERAYISLEEYFQIYAKHLDFDEVKALHLSRYLHDLGVFLHFQDDPLLRRTVILQNEWATTAVFRILDNETVKAGLGRFSQTDCNRLWKDSAYDHMHIELLALMKNFELCYELRESNPPVWLAPQLLPPAKPEALAGWGRSSDLVLQYKYDFLPKGMISRLTVRQHRFVRNPEMAWVTGVLFEQATTSVLVEVLPSGDKIELRARGPENKALLSVIAADLDALNESFKGLREKVEKLIPCNCKSCLVSTSPRFFEHKELVRRKEHRRFDVECSNSFERVDVLKLLDGFISEPAPSWAAKEAVTDPLRVIHIFLASSSELSSERDAFDLYLRQQNDELQKEGLYLKVVRWEYFLDAMSETRLQDEYNQKVKECDIFVSLFFTKAGRYTREEFSVAHQQFTSTGKPLIYTYIKHADVKTDWSPEDYASLKELKEALKELGYFPTRYTGIDDLKLQFHAQLAMIREKLHV